MLCAFLSLSYVFAFHWSSLVELYEEAHTAKRFSDNFKVGAETDVTVNNILRNLISSYGGMRVYVYRYHNGLAAISGVPFFFQSNTHELIAPGADRLMPYEQRIPASIHVSMNNNFIQDKCVLVSDTTVDKNDQNYYFYVSRNATSVARCPIFLANGDLFGFVGIDWNHATPPDAVMLQDLHRTASRLGAVFEDTSKKLFGNN
jgi:hypothetical protein